MKYNLKDSKSYYDYHPVRKKHVLHFSFCDGIFSKRVHPKMEHLLRMVL